MKIGNMMLLFGAATLISACGERDTETVTVDEDFAAEITETTINQEAGLPVSAPTEAIYQAHLAAQQLADRGEFIDANQAAISITEMAPEYVGGWILLGNSALSGEQFVKATRRAQELRANGTQAEQLWADVNMSFVTNDTDQGVRAAEQLVRQFPDSARAHLILSGMYTNQANHAAAREAARKATGLAPNMAVAHRALGLEFMNNEPKDQQRAQALFKKAIELEPDEDNNWVLLGDSHRAAGDLEAAAMDYTQALEIDESNAVAAVKRGHVNSFLGKYEQARADYDQGIAAAKGQSRSTLANYRAFVNLHAGDPQAAVEELKRVNAEIDNLDIPDHEKVAARNFVLTNIADVALHSDMDDTAVAAIDALSDSLGKSGQASGDDDFARQQKATAVYWRGKLQAELGDLDGATSSAEDFAGLLAGDDNPRRMERYHELLGFIALQREDYETAVAEYRQANLSTSPGGGDVKNIYMLATALDALGQAAEAAELKQQVANWNFNSVWFAMLRKKIAGDG